MGVRKCEEYKVLRFRDGDCTLVVEEWLHRVDEDDSGLTFEEWDPSADTDDSQAPVVMIVNSSRRRVANLFQGDSLIKSSAVPKDFFKKIIKIHSFTRSESVFLPDDLLLRRPRCSSFITHTSNLFCHFLKFFFFNDTSVLRASVTVVSPVLCAHVAGAHVPHTHGTRSVSRSIFSSLPFLFPFSFFLFFFLNYCNNSAPPTPKKSLY